MGEKIKRGVRQFRQRDPFGFWGHIILLALGGLLLCYALIVGAY